LRDSRGFVFQRKERFALAEGPRITRSDKPEEDKKTHQDEPDEDGQREDVH
jgi:hypothetical protein